MPPSRDFTRRQAAKTAAGAAALLAVGCSSSAGSKPATGSAKPATGSAKPGSESAKPGSGSSPEKPHLTVGAIQSVTAAGLYIAQQRGFFAPQGLRVTISATTGSGPVMADLVNGTLDVNFGNYVSFIAAQATGVAQLKIIEEGANATPREQEIVVPRDSAITSVAALRGTTIAVNALDNVAQLLVSAVLAGHGIPVSSVKFVTVPFPNAAAALLAHRVDAAFLVEPYLSQAVANGAARPLADTDQGVAASFPISGYATTAAWVSRYPKTAAAFLRALAKGQQLAATDRSAITQALPAFTKITPALAARVVVGTYPAGVSTAQIQDVADVMHKLGMLKQPFSVTPMIGV